jgi:hypothetical protein
VAIEPGLDQLPPSLRPRPMCSLGVLRHQDLEPATGCQACLQFPSCCL